MTKSVFLGLWIGGPAKCRNGNRNPKGDGFRNGERVDSLDNRLEEIEALEEARGKALQRM